jgi:hypothetical protein
VARLQQRFLELVAKQFPERDEVRYLVCPESENVIPLIQKALSDERFMLTGA